MLARYFIGQLVLMKLIVEVLLIGEGNFNFVKRNLLLYARLDDSFLIIPR